MSEDESTSIINAIRRTVIGPTDKERVKALSEKAADDPGTITEDEISKLADLLGHEDSEVVNSAITTLQTVASDRPDSVAELASHVVELLSVRPEEEWTTTPLREMDEEFMINLGAGSLLLKLAREDPDHLRPVVVELESMMMEGGGTLEPHAWFAMAHVAAADTADIDVDHFVEGTCRTLRLQIDDESDSLSLTVCPKLEAVELLRTFEDPAALDTLRYVQAETDDTKLATAAGEAVDAIEAKN